MKKSIVTVSTLGVFAVVLTGCGADNTASDVVPTNTAAQEQVEKGGQMMEQANKVVIEEEMVAEMEEVVVGGAPTTTIVEGAIASPDHTTLVAAVTAAGLAETLSGPGPFTVFAPVNAAFDRLPEGTVETLLKQENKADLAGILTYHVVPAKAMSGDVVKMITDGGGSATVTTVQGGTLTLKLHGKDVTVTDENGGEATVVAVDLEQSNGVIHVIDSVLLPGA